MPSSQRSYLKHKTDASAAFHMVHYAHGASVNNMELKIVEATRL